MFDEPPVVPPCEAALAAALRRASDDPWLPPPVPPDPPETSVVVVAPDTAAVELVVEVATLDFDRVLTAELVVVTAPDPADGVAVVGVLLGAVGPFAVVVGVTGGADVCAGGTSVDALQIAA